MKAAERLFLAEEARLIAYKVACDTPRRWSTSWRAAGLCLPLGLGSPSRMSSRVGSRRHADEATKRLCERQL